MIRDVEEALFGDISDLIEQARTRTAVAVNSELVMLYWSRGQLLRNEVLGGERAAYGQAIVKRLAARLSAHYGRGWSRQNLERMMRFASWIPDSEKCSTLSGKLSFSNTAELHLAQECCAPQLRSVRA
jgi:hypothetical protein